MLSTNVTAASIPASSAASEVRAETMRAIVQPAYGAADVLRFESAPVPTVGDDDVLLRVHAAAVCTGDVVLLTGKPYPVRLAFGLRRPTRPVAGQNVAGRVIAVGKNVTTTRIGDDVFGQVTGGFAEYVRAPASVLAPKPARLSYEQAAAMPVSGMTALQALRDVAKVQRGQKVLVHGASGGVGSFAVQIAKAMGAEVTAVCSTRHADRMRALGADHVVDYTREDFTRQAARYDVMLDLVADKSLAECRRVLTPKGVFVACGGTSGGPWFGAIVRMLSVVLAGLVATQRMASFIQAVRRDDLIALGALVDAGQLTPSIERRFPLADTADALRHVGAGHAAGTTVISVVAG